MIQFKKIPLGKPAILFLLFLTTSTTGFLRSNEETPRTTRHVRGTILSMDRREENIQVQNLPIRKLEINRQINEKDSIAERLYDRRSFRTGPIERSSQNIRQSDAQNREISIDTNRASRNVRIDIRDVNNNRQDRRSFASNILRENRHFTEQAVISRNRQPDAERRQLNVRTDSRKDERRDVRELDIRSNSNAGQTRDQILRTSQRRSIDLTIRNTPETRVAERRELQNRRTWLTDRESNRRQIDHRRSTERDVQRRSIRENSPYSFRREVLNRDSRVSRSPQDISRRSLEDRRSSENGEDQTRQPTERLQRSVSRDARDTIERPGVNTADRQVRQRSVSRREIHSRDIAESRSSTRSTENQQRRNTEQIRSLEDRRSTTVRAMRSSESRLLERSTERLERRISRDTRLTREPSERGNIESRFSGRQRSVERRSTEQRRLSDRLRSAPRLERGISKEAYTSRNSIQERSIDQRRENPDSVRNARDSRSDSTRNIKANTRYNRITYRRDASRLSHENQRNNHRRQRLDVSSKNEDVATDRYNPLTADSRKFFETLVSQRTTRDTERGALESVRNNVEHLTTKVDTNIWANTAKIVLAAFLIGQIFVNSSKQNKFRFHNILSMATSIKEKIQ